MSEVHAVSAQVEAVVQVVDRLWERQAADVPGWAAQELTFGQVRLLFLLARRGSTSIGRVAEWLGVGLPTASGTVERLERHGLVERLHRLDDRRVVDCQLTVSGHELLEEIAGMRLDVLRRTLVVLTPAELEQLKRIIQTVLDRTESNPRTSP